MPYADPLSPAAKASLKRRRDRHRTKMIEEGNCVNCGKPRNLYSRECDACVARFRARRRQETNRAFSRVRGDPERKESYRVSHNKVSSSYHRRVKLKVIEGYGGACQCCGESRMEFLTIDHINGNGRAERAKYPGGALYRLLLKEGCPTENHRLLCMNCNFALGRFGYCPHERELLTLLTVADVPQQVEGLQ